MNIITALKDFFDRGRVKSIFDHLRNLFYCSLIIAAGTYVHSNPPAWSKSIYADQIFGYPVIAIGAFLMFLNLAEGVYKLSKLKHPVLLSILITLFYLFLAVRMVVIMTEFRMR